MQLARARACASRVWRALCACKRGVACTLHVQGGCSLHWPCIDGVQLALSTCKEGCSLHSAYARGVHHACTKGVQFALCKQGAPCTVHVQRGCTLHFARAHGVHLALCMHKGGAPCTLHVQAGCSLQFAHTKQGAGSHHAQAGCSLHFARAPPGFVGCALGTYRAACKGTYRLGRACVCHRGCCVWLQPLESPGACSIGARRVRAPGRRSIGDAALVCAHAHGRVCSIGDDLFCLRARAARRAL